MLLAIPGQCKFRAAGLVSKFVFQDLGPGIDLGCYLYARRDYLHSIKSSHGASVFRVVPPLLTPYFQSEAYTFLAGSLGSLSLTLWFTPVL